MFFFLNYRFNANVQRHGVFFLYIMLYPKDPCYFISHAGRLAKEQSLHVWVKRRRYGAGNRSRDPQLTKRDYQDRELIPVRRKFNFRKILPHFFLTCSEINTQNMVLDYYSSIYRKYLWISERIILSFSPNYTYKCT